MLLFFLFQSIVDTGIKIIDISEKEIDEREAK